MLTRYANPERFMRLSRWALPVTAVTAVALFAIGLPWGLFFAPPDYQQGETVRIMFVHVPSSSLALGVFTFMGAASLMGLVWGHTLAHVAARAAAPVGAVYAGLSLLTGSLWGAPTWGTWWEWDARLTSMLVLFLTYLGYLALHAAIPERDRAARLAAVLCLAGLINVPIVKFSVDWWSTLHQPASLLREGGASIHPDLLWPLLINALAFLFAFIALTLAGMRAEIFQRRVEAASMRQARAAA
ncbi:MAG: heme transporter HemC [Alphaproteobacteria bacterium]|nr:heme transporter HemC [Alphaproteobacteria bacterium]